MFILKSKHDAAIAAKDAEARGLLDRLASAEQITDKLHRELWKMDGENAKLRTKLARYTAPRERGEGGRFLPLKRVS